MFLHLSGILFTGGVSGPVHAAIHTPWEDIPLGRPWSDILPGRHPLPGQTPPWADTHPLGRHTPPGQTHTPWSDMLGYSQQACGMHPTGMHSCYHLQMKFGAR